MKQGGFFSELERQVGLRQALPLVELAGDKRVLIENHRGITEYSRETISICVVYGQIVVIGSGMRICYMSKDQLVIQGVIDEIRIVRRC